MENKLGPTGPKKNYAYMMLLLGVIATLSKLLGFARDIVLSNIYGAGVVADAYLTTLAIPEMILDLLSNTIIAGFVPLAVEKLASSERDLNRFTTTSLKILTVMSLVLSTLVICIPGTIIGLLAPGFSGESYALAVQFLRMLSFCIMFRSVTGVLGAYLSTKKYFVPAAFLGVILDIAVIAAIWFSKRLDLIWLLPLGALGGTLLQMLFMAPFAFRQGFRVLFRDRIDWKDAGGLIAMGVPALLSVGLLHISTLFNRALASDITGGVTMLNNASRISYFAENIIVASVATVLYPLLSEFAVKGEKKQMSDTLTDAVEKIVTLLLPATAGLLVLSYPIINILYGHGAFTQENVQITSRLMCYNVLGIVGIGVQTLFTRALFSMKRIKLSAVISLVLLGVYLGLSYVFFRLFDLHGIALATGISYTVGGLLYYIVIHKVCGGLNNKSVLLTLLKSLLASGLMAGVILLMDRFWGIRGIVRLGVSVGAGALVYLLMAQLLGLKHMDAKRALRRIISKVKRQKNNENIDGEV